MARLRKDVWLWGGAVPALVIAFDQASKYWAIDKFGMPQNICAINPYPGLEIEVSPVFDLALVCNLGVSFGLFNNTPEISRIVFTLFAVIMCVVLLVWINKEKSKLITLALSLIIGGAIGNAIDRARFGAVTDFLNFSDIYFKWVFNVADAAITCGVIGLLIAMVFQSKEQKSP